MEGSPPSPDEPVKIVFFRPFFLRITVCCMSSVACGASVTGAGSDTAGDTAGSAALATSTGAALVTGIGVGAGSGAGGGGATTAATGGGDVSTKGFTISFGTTFSVSYTHLTLPTIVGV